MHYLIEEKAKLQRFELIKAALTGLLADHKDHPEERGKDETCSLTVARLACEYADAIIERLYGKTK